MFVNNVGHANRFPFAGKEEEKFCTHVFRIVPGRNRYIWKSWNLAANRARIESRVGRSVGSTRESPKHKQADWVGPAIKRTEKNEWMKKQVPDITTQDLFILLRMTEKNMQPRKKIVWHENERVRTNVANSVGGDFNARIIIILPHFSTTLGFHFL